MTTSDIPAVLVEELTKSYASTRAVDGVSFHIEPGEVFALLGPNGAGKTTTVETLEGYRKPDSGRVSVLGLDPIRDGARLKPRIGAMLQGGGMYPTIFASEALNLFSRYYANPRSPSEMLELVGLESAGNTPYRRMSGGQKQRLALALALIGRPELIFLDEPTAGMDPQARRSTWDLIGDMKRQGVTVLLTTHYLEEAERLADRVAIIDQGRLVASGTPASLRSTGASMVRLRVAQTLDSGELEALPSVRTVRREGDDVYILDAEDIPSLLVDVTTRLRALNIGVIEIRVGHASLEDVFLELTSSEARD